MRIYFSPNQDPMLVDSLQGMNATHERLRMFLASDERSVYLRGVVSGSAAPYDRLLAGLKVEKAEGPLLLKLDAEHGLCLKGSTGNLARYIEFFKFGEDEEGGHHHPEYVWENDYIAEGTMSLIIELDTEWIKDLSQKG